MSARGLPITAQHEPKASGRDGHATFLDRASPALRAAIDRLSGGTVDAAAIAAALPARAPSSSSPDTPPGFGKRRNRAEQRAAERVQQRARPRRDNYVDQLARHWRAQQAWLQRHRERMRERFGRTIEAPPACSIELWRDCTDIAFDLTGKAARIHLARVSPAWSAMIKRAALGELDGECVRDWSSERARGIAICGLILCREQKRTRRRGRYTGLVRGFTRGFFASACRGARARPFHRNTISGVHRLGAAGFHGSQIGYLDALERVGLFYRQRLPAHQVTPGERWTGRDGKQYAANRYWIANPNPYDGHLRDDVRKTLLALAKQALQSTALRLRPRARPAALCDATAAGSADAPTPAAPD